MKTKPKSYFRAASHSLVAAVLTGAVVLTASSAQSQNLFVSLGSGDIGEFTPGGAPSTFASGLIFPEGLAFNSAGNLFVAGSFDGNIYEYTPGGVQSTFASGLASPFGLAFNSAGNLFAADPAVDTIYEYTPGGAQSTFYGFPNASPYGLAFSGGNLFVAAIGGAAGSGTIYQITPLGVQTTFATAGLNQPYDLAFDNAGDLFVANNDGTGAINEYNSVGALINTFYTPDSGAFGLAFDSAGNLFVSDWSSNIYEYTASGVLIKTFASGLVGSVNGPLYMAFQPVPEPSALELLALGITVLLFRRRRQ